MTGDMSPMYSEGLWNLVRPREGFVDLPSLGCPTDEEINWRRHIRPGSPARRAAALRAKTFAEWAEHLAGDDIPWALRAARYLKYIIVRHEQRIARLAVEQGYGWDEIGVYLGVSRQAVAQRFGRLLMADQEERRPDPPDPRVR